MARKESYRFLLFYLALFGLLLPVSGLVLFMVQSGFFEPGFSGLRLLAHFAGDSARFISGKTVAGYLEAHVWHLFAYAMTFFFLGHFYLIGRYPLSRRRMVMWSALIALDLIFAVAAIKAGSPFHWLKFATVVLLCLSFCFEFIRFALRAVRPRPA